jgi:hypothetical protein
MNQYHNDPVVQITNDEYYDGSNAEIGRRGWLLMIFRRVGTCTGPEKYDSLKKITDSLLRK